MKIKYYSEVLDATFDTEEELNTAESEYSDIMKLGDELQCLRDKEEEATKWFNEETENVLIQYKNKLSRISERRDEIKKTLDEYKYEAEKDDIKEEKKCCKKKCNNNDGGTFHFEYRSSENGKEKEHFIANTREEFMNYVSKFLEKK